MFNEVIEKIQPIGKRMAYAQPRMHCDDSTLKSEDKTTLRFYALGVFKVRLKV